MKDSVDNQITGIRISRNEAKLDEFDIKIGVTYCEKYIGDLVRQWQDMTIVNRIRLQKHVFPSGLVFDKKSKEFVGTAQLSPIFALNKDFSQTKRDPSNDESLLVAGVGFEPTTCWL